MTIFLDIHPLHSYTREQLIAGLEDDADEFGVTVLQMMFNEKENILHCICSAPDIEAVKKHHMKFNTKCDKIFPIDQIKADKIIKDEKLKTIGELSARLAHDLRNPLSVIQSAIEIIKARYPEINEKEKLKFNMIFDAISRIDHQASDVLGYLSSRNLIFSHNKISEILNSSLEGVEIPNQVVIEKLENDIEIDCDFESIRVVFINIILNAIQAMKNSGKITVKTILDNNFVSILFENSGPSIPEKLTSKIFEPLFTTKQEGTGLGLVSCKNIVNNHGGKIEVKNNPTTFTVILPQEQTK